MLSLERSFLIEVNKEWVSKARRVQTADDAEEIDEFDELHKLQTLGINAGDIKVWLNQNCYQSIKYGRDLKYFPSSTILLSGCLTWRAWSCPKSQCSEQNEKMSLNTHFPYWFAHESWWQHMNREEPFCIFDAGLMWGLQCRNSRKEAFTPYKACKWCHDGCFPTVIVSVHDAEICLAHSKGYSSVAPDSWIWYQYITQSTGLTARTWCRCVKKKQWDRKDSCLQTFALSHVLNAGCNCKPVRLLFLFLETMYINYLMIVVQYEFTLFYGFAEI